MGRRRLRKCFWCEIDMVMPRHQPHHGKAIRRLHLPHEMTRDHVIPRSQLPAFGDIITMQIRCRNKVKACNRCNNVRGNMDPIIWSTQHRPESMGRLAHLLIEMGFPRALVIETFRQNNPTFNIEGA